ncbi:MAG: hypothetical protein J6N21_14105 [Butyrivibrio sp.]|nr:hypothetical protein [Butyrivibrio sp.]
MSCKKVDQKIIIGIALVVYLIMAVLYVGRVYPFDILPDEFGYWQNVALIRGLDWKQVSALGDYYSYGYSFILLPIHLLASSPLAAYRIAVVFNLIMLFIAGIVLMKITDVNPCFCLIYPPLVYYALTTMSEAFLFIIFTLALLVLKRYLRSRNTTDGVLLIVLLVFLFTIHMRTLPLLVVALLLLRDKDGEDKSGKKRFIGLIILTMIIFVLALYAGLIFQKPIIAANGSARTGFYAVLKSFGSLYSLNSLKRFLLAVIGEVFYIGAASLGLAYIGLVRIIRKVREKQDFEYFYLVSLLCEMALSALFLYMSESSLSVIYGRYIDFMVPGLMLYGVREVEENGFKIRQFLILMAAMAITALLVIPDLIKFGRVESLFALGINYFLVEETSPVVMIAIACLSGCVGLVGMLAAGALRESKDKATMIFGVFSAFFIAFAYYIGGDMVNSNMSYSKENVELADRLKDTGDDKIFYIYSEEQPAVQILQFMLPEKPIEIIKTVDEITGYDIMSENYIVVPAYDIINNQLSDKYELYDETRTFKVWK